VPGGHASSVVVVGDEETAELSSLHDGDGLGLAEMLVPGISRLREFVAQDVRILQLCPNQALVTGSGEHVFFRSCSGNPVPVRAGTVRHAGSTPRRPDSSRISLPTHSRENRMG